MIYFHKIVINFFKRSLSEQRFKNWLLVIIIFIIIAKRVNLSPFNFFVANESQWVLMSLNKSQWVCKSLNESEWDWISLNESEWDWMRLRGWMSIIQLGSYDYLPRVQETSLVSYCILVSYFIPVSYCILASAYGLKAISDWF